MMPPLGPPLTETAFEALVLVHPVRIVAVHGLERKDVPEDGLNSRRDVAGREVHPRRAPRMVRRGKNRLGPMSDKHRVAMPGGASGRWPRRRAWSRGGSSLVLRERLDTFVKRLKLSGVRVRQYGVGARTEIDVRGGVGRRGERSDRGASRGRAHMRPPGRMRLDLTDNLGGGR